MAPKGAAYTQAPQEMHLELSMLACFSSPMEIALILQVDSQGRR